MNLKPTVLCHLCFINAFFHTQAAFLKTKQQLSRWIVASGHREHVMILIFQMKSRPKCQTDVDSVCSQTFSHILGLIRGQQRVLLVFAPLHTRFGAFATDTSHMSVRFYCECKCLGSILWPRRLNVVYVFFIVTSVFFCCCFLFLSNEIHCSCISDPCPQRCFSSSIKSNWAVSIRIKKQQ